METIISDVQASKSLPWEHNDKANRLHLRRSSEIIIYSNLKSRQHKRSKSQAVIFLKNISEKDLSNLIVDMKASTFNNLPKAPKIKYVDYTPVCLRGNAKGKNLRKPEVGKIRKSVTFSPSLAPRLPRCLLVQSAHTKTTSMDSKPQDEKCQHHQEPTSKQTAIACESGEFNPPKLSKSVSDSVIFGASSSCDVYFQEIKIERTSFTRSIDRASSPAEAMFIPSKDDSEDRLIVFDGSSDGTLSCTSSQCSDNDVKEQEDLDFDEFDENIIDYLMKKYSVWKENHHGAINAAQYAANIIAVYTIVNCILSIFGHITDTVFSRL